MNNLLFSQIQNLTLESEHMKMHENDVNKIFATVQFVYRSLIYARWDFSQRFQLEQWCYFFHYSVFLTLSKFSELEDEPVTTPLARSLWGGAEDKNRLSTPKERKV